MRHVTNLGQIQDFKKGGLQYGSFPGNCLKLKSLEMEFLS